MSFETPHQQHNKLARGDHDGISSTFGGMGFLAFMSKNPSFFHSLSPPMLLNPSLVAPAAVRQRILPNRRNLSVYMGGCQNCGPFSGTLNIRCRSITGIQKGTIILTTTHISLPTPPLPLPFPHDFRAEFQWCLVWTRPNLLSS